MRRPSAIVAFVSLLLLVFACPGWASPERKGHHAKAGHIQRTPVQVEYTYLGVSTQQAWRQQEECVAPLTMLEAWGWQVTNEANGRVKLQVEDQSIEVTLREVEGQDCVLLREAIRLLDGNSTWATPDHLQITGRVRVIRFVSHHVQVSSSLSVSPKASQPDTLGIAHLRLTGATLSPDAILDVEPSVKVATNAPNELTISFPASPFSVSGEALQPSKEIDLDSSLAITATTNTPMAADAIALGTETDQGLSLDLGATRRLSGPIRVARLDATTLKLTLPGVQIEETPPVAPTSSLAAITAKPLARGTELIFQLKRPMGIKLSQSGNRIQLVLVKPPVGDGKIANKIIVVDAGHGGKDTGGTHVSGLAEKEITLAVAKRLGADLAAEGATVIMTRDTDDFISLDERANIANRNHADLFLCVHINSNGSDHKSSGTITFYHGSNIVSSTLADCIQREIVKVSGIPGIGCWSDTKIYRSGFSVLRNTKMPGVLMELGFINNNYDRHQLVREDVQDAIAAAVVKGVKTYLGEGN